MARDVASSRHNPFWIDGFGGDRFRDRALGFICNYASCVVAVSSGNRNKNRNLLPAFFLGEGGGNASECCILKSWRLHPSVGEGGAGGSG